MTKPKGKPTGKAAIDRNGGWEDVEGSQIEGWEVDKHVEGRFLGFKSGQFGPLIRIEDAEGAYRVFGSPAILTSRMEGIPAGDMVRITCLGKTTTGQGREAWDFRVQRKRAVKSSQQQEVPF